MVQRSATPNRKYCLQCHMQRILHYHIKQDSWKKSIMQWPGAQWWPTSLFFFLFFSFPVTLNIGFHLAFYLMEADGCHTSKYPLYSKQKKGRITAEGISERNSHILLLKKKTLEFFQQSSANISLVKLGHMLIPSFKRGWEESFRKGRVC